MSRFGTTLTFLYKQPADSWGAATAILLSQSQMPQYPMEETRITDRKVLRNLNGDAYVYSNYNKQCLTFRWTYLDEAKVNQLRSMFNSNGIIIWDTNGSFYGTYFIDGDPSISETQFEMYDVTAKFQEM